MIPQKFGKLRNFRILRHTDELGPAGEGGGGGSRYINERVPTWENFLDPVLEKYSKKTYLFLKKQG